MKRIFEILGELLLLVLYPIINILGIFVALKTVNKQANKKYPVVFVHGWFTQNVFYACFKRYLERKGFAVYMTNFGLHLGDLTKLGKRLARYLEERQLEEVVLVGISAGALASLFYLQKLNGWNRVKTFISVGAPYKGTPIAYVAFFSQAARQMFPGSKFLQTLWAGGIQNPGRIVSITGSYDTFIPTLSSYIPGAQNVTVDVFGHFTLGGFSKRVYVLVAQYAH